MAPDVLRQNLAGAADAFFERTRTGEISDAEARNMLRDYATGLLKDIRPDAVVPERAWEYAEILIAANRWAEAEKMLLIATKNSPSEDRRVNDTLRLARCQAMLGDAKSAVASAQSTFNAPPKDKAPILLAVLLEIVPAAQGKGSDLQLAQLLEGAILQGEAAQVDLESDPGKQYMQVLKFHVRSAAEKVVELYTQAGRPELAESVRSKYLIQ